MATLKANGPELLRISREQNVIDESIIWERLTIVYQNVEVV